MSSVTLYHGDCLEYMKTMPDKSVDAVITDPPYGISFAHGGGGGCLARSTRFAGKVISGDDMPFDPGIWLKYKIICLWGANYYSNRLPNSPCWLVWDKRDGVCSNDQADCELAWTNLKSPARLKRHLWNGMLKFSERGERRVHPMQKPVELLKWTLEQCEVPVMGTVFDPFMGSGTTGVACMQTGRNFIGCEIDKDYFEIAKKRIEAAQAQGDLFDGIEKIKEPEQTEMEL